MCEKIKVLYYFLVIAMSVFFIVKCGIFSDRIFSDIYRETIPDGSQGIQRDLSYEPNIWNYSEFIPCDPNPEEVQTAETDGNTENTSQPVQEDEPDIEVIAPALYDNSVEKINYSMEQLSNYDFLVSNCYIVDKSTYITPEELDINMLMSKDTSIKEGEGYKVLIYHTHGSEAFCDSREGVVEDTVIGLGDELTAYLESYGIKVYHDRNIYDCIDGKLDRSKAYDLARENVDRILAENPSIEVVLDIHRDGVREDLKLVQNINGKPTAKIMFVNGMSRNAEGELDYLANPNRVDNLSFSLKMHLKGKNLYGNLMRKIYLRAYCYNLDCVPKAALIEVGAQTNTVEEAKNAMAPLSIIIYEVLMEPPL